MAWKMLAYAALSGGSTMAAVTCQEEILLVHTSCHMKVVLQSAGPTGPQSESMMAFEVAEQHFSVHLFVVAGACDLMQSIDAADGLRKNDVVANDVFSHQQPSCIINTTRQSLCLCRMPSRPLPSS